MKMARKQPSPAESNPETTPEAAAEAVETTETTAASETVQESVEAPQTALEKTEPAEGFAEAIREGAHDACSAAAGFLPSVGGMIHKGVYHGFYYLTYGVVFSSLVVGSLIPSNNAMGDGVRAGFKAAKDDFEAQKTAAGGPAADEGLAPA
jgi:hypothetical protein